MLGGADNMKLAVRAAALLAAVLLGGCERSPARKGELRAQRDVAAGKQRIFHYGRPWSEGKPLVDDATGLPVEIVAGCDVTREFREETDAYNETMAASAAGSSLPATPSPANPSVERPRDY